MNGINNMGGKGNQRARRTVHVQVTRWAKTASAAISHGHVAGGQVGATVRRSIWILTHFSDEDVHHLQYVLMPADKETYLDYCAARGIEFKKAPLEVEVSK